jgi:hypothetical protein
MNQILAAASSPRDAIQQLMMLVSDLFCVGAGTLYHYDDAQDQLVKEDSNRLSQSNCHVTIVVILAFSAPSRSARST